MLATWTTPAGKLAATERAIACGTAVRAAQLGHQIDSVSSETTILDGAPGATRDTATVSAHVITTIVWHADGMEQSTEASGIDHTISLQRVAGTWQVVGDSYLDDLAPSYLEAAGEPPEVVREAVRRLEHAASRPVAVSGNERKWVARASALRRYKIIITYNRTAAAAYADRYALSYSPAYVRFGADCANFASQGACAGGMPLAGSTYSTGWWYDKKGTSSTSDDSYSLSWINVTQQMSYWNGSRTDWASSITSLGKGDMVYYDWSGDGFWDHVAVVAGTNSAGQTVVDAHTTDYYRTYWKMGYSSTKYKFARVRAQWVV